MHDIRAHHCVDTVPGAASLPCKRWRAVCIALAEHMEAAMAGERRPWLQPVEVDHPAVAALDSIEQPLLVVDSDWTLLHANQAGHHELACGDWLRIVDGRIRGERWLGAILQRQTEELFGPGECDRLHIELPIHNGRHGDLWVRRLLRRTDSPHLLLLTLVLTAAGAKTAEAAAEAHAGLRYLRLTPRQRELASHLLGGLTLTQAAERMSISRATANDHLKALFALSRTRRQPELLSWLTRNMRI